MKLAIYDFDGTLFNEETIPYLLENWEKFNNPINVRPIEKKKI